MAEGGRVVRGGRVHYAWIVLGTVAVMLMAASGVRSAFGVFIKPMESEFGWGRTSMSVVASLSLFLYGAIGPLVGRLADRWGPRRVLAAACVLVGVGTLGTSTVVTLWQLYLTAGLLTALGAGGVAMSVAASLVARWFDARRGLVLGIAGGGMAAGQLLVVPGAMALTVTWGWRAAFVALGLGFLVIVLPLALALIRDDPADLGLRPYGATGDGRSPGLAGADGHRASLREAFSSGPFWLLAGSFWVCGYTTSGLVLTHLIPHATEHGFHASQAAQALGLMGALNVVGTVLSGWICDRFGHKGPLATYYLLRGVSLLFLPYVGTAPGLFAFAAVYGLNYISTVPATTSLTAKIYGRYAVGELSGWIFFAHQVGSAVGSLAGGHLYDRFGDYTVAFHSAALLAFVATAMVLAIREQPVVRRPARPAAATA